MYGNMVSDRHLNSYIHTIITYLKQHDKPVTFSEIHNRLNINLYANKSIKVALSRNPKIEVTEDTVSLNPTYKISCLNDLLEVVKSANGGIEVAELLDVPMDLGKKIGEYIASLQEARTIYTLKDMDGSQIIFYNDMIIEPASSEVKDCYVAVKVPDYEEIIVTLKEAGLKGGNSAVKKIVTVAKRGIRKGRRKIKITNTHVKDLDMNF